MTTLEQRRKRAQDIARAVREALGPGGPRDLARILAKTLQPEEARDLAQELVGALAETLNFHDGAVGVLEELLQDLGTGPRPPTNLEAGHFVVPGPSHYHAVREAMALNTFQQVGESPWPTAVLGQGGARGVAQLRPAGTEEQALVAPEELECLREMMWKQREELSDLDADVLDALSALWISNARSPKDDAVAAVDDLLSMRRLQPKLGGNGCRGGYRPHQRAEVLRALCHIQNLWIQMVELEVYEVDSRGRRRTKPTRHAIQSRAFVITDRMGQIRLDGLLDVQKFVFRPGKVFAMFLFGPGRQIALLAAKALAYDPHRQSWEKRLTRFLSWQWRCDGGGQIQGVTFSIPALLEVVGERPDEEKRPGRIRDHLEKAFETLQQDKVISGWAYVEEEVERSKGWVQRWLGQQVRLDPPKEVQELYRSLERQLERKTAPRTPNLLAEQVRQRRKALGLSQAEAASQLGISQGYLSQVECGHLETVSQKLSDRLKEWL